MVVFSCHGLADVNRRYRILISYIDVRVDGVRIRDISGSGISDSLAEF